jgi:hypothetical protein
MRGSFFPRIGSLRQLRLVILIFSVFGYPVVLRGQPNEAVLVGAGDIAGCNGGQGNGTAKLLDRIAGTVFTVGDNVYSHGTALEFVECYSMSWGRHRSRTRPAPGNHDYESEQARPYFDYFGANAGPAGLGYYSYTLGDWHIVSLNSNTNARSWGAAQEEWLRRDLAASRSNCTLAYWHSPFFSSGERYGNVTETANLFRILYEHATAALVSGHEHFYERFAPQDPNGHADPTGIRQFVAGTGGARLYKLSAAKPNSEVRNNVTHGVLKLTLNRTGYSWEFIPVAGQTFSDRGNASCPARKR